MQHDGYDITDKIATAGDSFFFSSPFSEVDQLTTFGAKWPKRADFTP
ncbi:hypothetical protein EC971742_2065, partial [Escherichia coli 97.1742]